MAKVEISKWEIAKMFGLEYLGVVPADKGEYRDMRHTYKYDFHGKEMSVKGWIYEPDSTHEKAAEIVLLAIGKVTARRYE